MVAKQFQAHTTMGLVVGSNIHINRLKRSLCCIPSYEMLPRGGGGVRYVSDPPSSPRQKTKSVL